MADASLVNGPIWNIVKASLPKGASDSEIYKKTDQVLKDHHISWDSAKQGKTTDGSSYTKAKQDIFNELFPPAKPAAEQGSGGTGSNVATNAALSTPANNASRTDWAEFLATATPEDLASKWEELQAYYQKGGNYNGFNTYLSGQGASATSTSGQLASRTGGYLYNLTGKQFLPGYNLNSLQYKA